MSLSDCYSVDPSSTLYSAESRTSRVATSKSRSAIPTILLTESASLLVSAKSKRRASESSLIPSYLSLSLGSPYHLSLRLRLYPYPYSYLVLTTQQPLRLRRHSRLGYTPCLRMIPMSWYMRTRKSQESTPSTHYLARRFPHHPTRSFRPSPYSPGTLASLTSFFSRRSPYSGTPRRAGAESRRLSLA
jgi:hypothetical protein